MYKLTVTKTVNIFTIPQKNLGLFAFTQAQDRGMVINSKDHDVVVNFLASIGILVGEENGD